MSLDRRLASEAIGSAFLLCAIVGSGIMGERLAGGNVAIALLANTFATGAVLVALILALGGISAHLNPAVTLAEAWQGSLPWREVLPYFAAEIGGALVGVAIAHIMFGLPLLSISQHARGGPAQMFSEFVATFGLVGLIQSVSRQQDHRMVSFVVGAYITAAYWFTASTSFANPAVAVARTLSDTFVGIRPADVGGFVLAQIAGATSATIFFAWLFRKESRDVEALVTSHAASAGGRGQR